MPLTRTDYEAIAKVLAKHKPNPKTGTVGQKMLWVGLVNDFVKDLSRGRGFDAALFRQNAGMTAGDHGDDYNDDP